MASRPRRSASRHSIVKPAQPRSWIHGPDLRRNYLSLFLVQVTISLIGVVLTLASAIAFGTRLQRRRKYDFVKEPSRSGDNPLSLMVTLAPSLCSACVFFVFFLLAYKMMMPKYKRRIFLVSHLFCVVSMVSLSVYAAAILADIHKFPDGSIGILDERLEKEIANLNNSVCLLWRVRSAHGDNHDEGGAFLRYFYFEDECVEPNKRKFDTDCKDSHSCFYDDAVTYGHRVTLFLFFTVASAVSAVVTVCIVVRQDKKEAELPPTEPYHESTRQPAEAGPLLPVPASPTDCPSPILTLPQ